MARLRAATAPQWQHVVLGDLDAFLLDHAACERKASATALSMVAHYPDKLELVEAMIVLAREELEHFEQVTKILHGRGLQLGKDVPDPYIQGLRPHLRNGRADYFLDRLLLGGVVEARGCERFGLVAQNLPHGALKEFYEEITRSEARHQGLFFRLARVYFEHNTVEKRLNTWLDVEAELVQSLPIRPALH